MCKIICDIPENKLEAAFEYITKEGYDKIWLSFNTDGVEELDIFIYCKKAYPVTGGRVTCYLTCGEKTRLIDPANFYEEF